MGVFADSERDRPGRILSLGWYLPQRTRLDTAGMLRFVREGGETGYRSAEIRDLAAAKARTRLIDALNRGRVWALKKLTEELDALLAPEIAIAVVPGHTPFGDEAPLVGLGRAVAGRQERLDVTGVLTRTQAIRRIAYGGPSYRSLHRDTIVVSGSELLVGRPVLLLDDIVRSGASLRACRELLEESGAESVQCLALGRVR
jgi:hypothetical protein